jgi:hypothetical protein
VGRHGPGSAIRPLRHVPGPSAHRGPVGPGCGAGGTGECSVVCVSLTQRHQPGIHGRAKRWSLWADRGSAAIKTLAMRIWALCASTSRADGDRWLRPGPLPAGRSGQSR